MPALGFSKESSMPILDVKVSAPFSPALVERISSSLAGLTSSVLQKKPEVIAIAVSFVDPAAWVIAGKTLAAHCADQRRRHRGQDRADRARHLLVSRGWSFLP
jgi:phenylpyruvate tautomerase PptA (4-oxalocrotonate tautomerase family)